MSDTNYFYNEDWNFVSVQGTCTLEETDSKFILKNKCNVSLNAFLLVAHQCYVYML